MEDNSACFTSAVSNVSFPTPNGDNCPGYLSPHGKESSLGVVVIQEWWGMNESIQKTADIIGQSDFRALVPDLYRGKVAKDSEQAGHLMHGLDFPKAIKDIVGAALYLKSGGCTKVGVVGFCMGGALVISTLANSKELDAGVAFYGLPDVKALNLSAIKVPVQCHFGNQDMMKGFSDPETANNFERTMKEAGVSVEVHRYDNAGHAFMNRDRPSAYNPQVAEVALHRTVNFFRGHLGSSSNALHVPAIANVSFPTPNGDCPAYLSAHGKDSSMGVVVLQEWWGMNESIQKMVDIFGQYGYRSLVPDLYRGKVAKNNEDAGHLMGGLNWGVAVSDIGAAVQFLKGQGCKKVGVVGFCMGGALVIAASANAKGIDAGVSFYGIPDLSHLNPANIQCALQGHFGNDDPAKGFSDKEAVNNLEKKMREANVPIEIHRYECVGHAFMNRDRPTYAPKVADLALKRTLAFFAEKLQA